MADNEDSNQGAEAPKEGLSPKTKALAKLILAGIKNARPNDPTSPKTIDAVVSLALNNLKAQTERQYPEYFEVKPARTIVKAGA